MHFNKILVLTCIVISVTGADLTNFRNIKSYARIFKLDGLLANETSNELWRGLFRDCDKKVTFSCIQRNAYAYLDNVLVDRDNITVFNGLLLTKNSLNYGTCRKGNDEYSVDENLVDDSTKRGCAEEEDDDPDAGSGRRTGRGMDEERLSPLEEVTNALRKRTVRFLATRDYEVQLPELFFHGASIKVSPREVDENGALLRVDFRERAVASQGRIFKKIKKFIQNRLLTSFLALLLLIKLIQVKFMFVIPFLFGVGTAKKLFLKLLLFFIPAFAHIFKLCSSYYSSHSTKYHHHHHQIAHHHHHVPVPVPVPTYYNHHHHHRPDEEFDGYDYAHPHIQYRKDIEELKEWGIEPYEEPYEELDQHLGQAPGRLVSPAPAGPAGVLPGALQGTTYGAYGIPQYAANVRPIGGYQEKRPAAAHAHNLAYSAYVDDAKYNRRNVLQQASVATPAAGVAVASPLNAAAASLSKNYALHGQNLRAGQNQKPVQQLAAGKAPVVPRRTYDDDFYGPIVARLEEIFVQLRFYEEVCRERLVCSMYKTPAVYSPHSNLVSNELSRDPQELNRAGAETVSSQRFHRYLIAARLGQDGGDCLRTYPCRINTE